MKEMFPPEKCPKCKADTVVMHYDNGYRVECPNNPKCDWYGEFHFDELTKPEFEALLKKSAQPLPKLGQPPAQETKQTLESQTSDDCNESHTR